jgi:microcystin degradation protein MlrC
MRVVVACIEQETNSFSPIPSPLSRFGRKSGPYFGREGLEEFQNTRISFAALVQAARSWGAEIDVPVVGRCATGAPVADADYEVIAQAVIESVRKGCDAVLLGLHGALLTQSGDDDGLLLERLRRLAPETPIGVSWDFHATMNPRKVENPTVAVCYKTAPHTDIFETGEAVAKLMRRVLDGEVKPVTVWGNVPMIGDSDSARMTTSSPLMAQVMAMAVEAEKHPRILACNVFGGCAVADTRESGPSCVVVTNNDPELGAQVRDKVLSALWERRKSFLYIPDPLTDVVAKAKAVKAAGAKGPVVLGDNCDSANSGGTDDDMTVIREVMKQGLTDVAVAPIRDPEVAAAMHAAGNGATITVDLGHKVQPVDGPTFKPLRVTGTVSGLYDGQLVVTGPVFTGTRRDMGPCGCLTVGDLQFVVTTERAEPFDCGIFEKLGINPREKQFLVLKGGLGFGPVYSEFAAEVLYCGGNGANKTVMQAAADGSYKHVRRPIFPLDEDVEFSP